MLRVTQSSSAGAASRYFDAALNVADYYGKGEKTIGLWSGQAAEKIGLPEEVTKKDFEAVLNGMHPVTGETLDGVRHRENRSPGYDFTFSVPKSVSIYMAATGDNRPRELFHAAVNDTMRDIESKMEARVRKDGQDTNRTTGNAVWALFAHETSRPVDGVPDPHSHVHAYVANLTFDSQEGKWKAGQFRDLKRHAPLYEAAFHSRLAAALQQEGYGVTTNGRDFELTGVSREMIGRFSRRTALVEATARDSSEKIGKQAARLVSGGMNAKDAMAMAKSELGGRTREGKSQGLSGPELEKEWKSRFTPQERQVMAAVRGAPSSAVLSPDQAVELASEHLFERQSVAHAFQLEAAALRLGCGLAPAEVSAAVSRAVDKGDLIRGGLNGQPALTSRQALADESRMVELCREGRGAASPLGAGKVWEISRSWLDDQQQAAVKHVLESPDTVLGIRGKAGTGKTTMMRECADALLAHGQPLRVFAPSSEAVQVLKGEGFEDASTIQQLIVNPAAQREAAGKTLWIDEAGLISAKQMRAVMEYARENGSRIILSGDRGQHRSVERGDTLAILEDRAGIRTVELSRIKRQQVEDYREAAAAFGGERPGEGFDRLDAMGWVHEISDTRQRIDFAVETYFEKTALFHRDGTPHTATIVAPTHAEIAAVTGQVRAILKERETIGKEDFPHSRLVNLGFTAAQRRDARNYQPGQTVEFVQNGKGGFVKGQQWTVISPEGSGEVVMERAGGRRTLDLAQAARFNVYRVETAGFATGDVVRATQNKGELLNNSRHRVLVAGPQQLKLEDLSSGKVREVEGLLHLTHAYAATSHASQGKTLDHVVISQPSSTFAVASREQGNVSVTRARLSATWITDDKQALREAISRSEARPSALDLVEGPPPQGQGQGQGPKMAPGTSRTQEQSLREAVRKIPAPANKGKTPDPGGERPRPPSPALNRNPRLGRDRGPGL